MVLDYGLGSWEQSALVRVMGCDLKNSPWPDGG